MKKILKSILVGIVFSAIFTCVSYAKPVRTYIMPDEYATVDCANFYSKTYNDSASEVNNTFPLITDLKQVETPIQNSNVYMGNWGDYSTVVFEENASNNRLISIIVATPSALFSDDFKKNYGTEPAYQFVTEVLTLQGSLESINKISDSNKAISKQKITNCLNNQVSDSFSVGKLHYDYNYGKDVITFAVTAYTDDGK